MVSDLDHTGLRGPTTAMGRKYVEGAFSDSGQAEADIPDVRGPSILLASGERIYLLDPRPEEIHLFDIAYALGNICRFTGHTTPFYSVAQHCVMVSELAEPADLGLEGLFHDAAEAYTGDLNRPLKLLLEVQAPGLWSGIEERLDEAIAKRFGLQYPRPGIIKYWDNRALHTEQRDVMPAGSRTGGLPPPMIRKIEPLSPADARTAFIDRYRYLGGKQVRT